MEVMSYTSEPWPLVWEVLKEIAARALTPFDADAWKAAREMRWPGGYPSVELSWLEANEFVHLDVLGETMGQYYLPTPLADWAQDQGYLD